MEQNRKLQPTLYIHEAYKDFNPFILCCSKHPVKVVPHTIELLKKSLSNYFHLEPFSKSFRLLSL